ncbi:MAG TPA: hypothetical protein VKQ54_02135 [Caulobacteraceae bacterium]|nr:hypothetical protein [Caulobacteraceae bacterium]
MAPLLKASDHLLDAPEPVELAPIATAFQPHAHVGPADELAEGQRDERLLRVEVQPAPVDTVAEPERLHLAHGEGAEALAAQVLRVKLDPASATLGATN